MIEKSSDVFLDLKKAISNAKKSSKELESLLVHSQNNMATSQIGSLINMIKKSNNDILEIVTNISLTKPLVQKEEVTEEIEVAPVPKQISRKTPVVTDKLSDLEKQALKRSKIKVIKTVRKEIDRPNTYVQIANRFFSNSANYLVKKNLFQKLEKDLMQSNMQFIIENYVASIIFTMLLSFIGGFFVFVFLLFFNVSTTMPFLSFVTESIFTRALKISWILIALPIVSLIFMYVYPSMEKKSYQYKINQEIPFATIHMSSIAGSMIDPTQIFYIIISTNEYPFLQKEFTKLINEINLHGYDLITALRRVALSSPSAKLADLFNGLATTINSGGDLAQFFNRRAQSLLFDYKIEQEKHTRAAETFMDIYISIVIAAPMILMILMMIMKISGLGLQFSATLISFFLVIGVSVINIGFLTFLNMKKL